MKLSFRDLLSVKFSLLNIIIILIITALIIAVLFIVYFPFGSLNLNVQQADKYLKSDQGLKILALNEYKQAETDWPFLKFNQPLQNRIKEAEKVIEDYKQNTAALTIFLKDTDEARIKELVNKLEETNGVREVKYTSKEEALKIYRERNKDNP
ncbi:hypothetical protein HYW44_01495 [Candidatus Daviesbacteria bacterium]|nr:hypothetical protein [Candidatus Daviesbacteria bacterium]